MIHVRQLVKFYGSHLAVDHVDLDAGPGCIVGLLGPNGAGKTTTLRILTGYMPPTRGSANVNGFDVFTQSLDARRSIGYLPESNPLYHEMTVTEQLHYFGKLHGLNRSTRVKRITDLTARCGLDRILRRPIGHLSKGNRQRVGLAQALLHDPPVLILDEPTVGLDPSQISEIRSLIMELGTTKTILLSTHILPEVERTCGNVVILAAGKVVARGSPAELIAQVRSRSRVLVTVKAPHEQVQSVLEKHAHVGSVSVTHAGPWTTAAVTPRHAGEDIREWLGDQAIERHWPIREIRHETASLEEFFIQATNPANVHAA